MSRHLIAIYRCCRDWPCVIGSPVGRCGLCGEVPTFVSVEEAWWPATAPS